MYLVQVLIIGLMVVGVDLTSNDGGPSSPRMREGCYPSSAQIGTLAAVAVAFLEQHQAPQGAAAHAAAGRPVLHQHQTYAPQLTVQTTPEVQREVETHTGALGSSLSPVDRTQGAQHHLLHGTGNTHLSGQLFRLSGKVQRHFLRGAGNARRVGYADAITQVTAGLGCQVQLQDGAWWLLVPPQVEDEARAAVVATGLPWPTRRGTQMIQGGER